MARRLSGEGQVEAAVASARHDPVRRDGLVDLLAETSPVYDGLSMSTTARLRGWVLAAFEDVSLPGRALPFAMEELQSGVEPYLVAAAAKAVRGGARNPALGPYLLTAFANMESRDDTVTFEALRPPWPPRRPTTALVEILSTVRWLGAASAVGVEEWEEAQRRCSGRLSQEVRSALADTIGVLKAEEHRGGSCCSSAAAESRPARLTPPVEATLDGIELEDQHGRCMPATDLLHGAPSVVAFFYTRCPNPNKCSLTVTNLAALQHRLAEEGDGAEVRLLGLTYDPGYDGPDRLRRYGEARGLRFGPAVRMARATKGHDRLQAYFGLQVGYGSAIVNRHAIELFLLDAGGSIVHSWARIRWEPADVLTRTKALLSC